MKNVNKNDDNMDNSKEDQKKQELKEIFGRNMIPVIERWERYIIAAGNELEPDISQDEMDKFKADVSNPSNIRDYIEKWSANDADCEEEIKEEEIDEDDDIEVVITDDEEDDDEEDEDVDMEDFII